DEDGGFSDFTTTALVRNLAPTAVLSNSGPIFAGDSAFVFFTGASDPSADAARAGFHFAYDFNNDGVFDLGDGTYAGSVADAQVSGPPELFLGRTAPVTVRGRIIDRDGGFPDYTTTIAVRPVTVSPKAPDVPPAPPLPQGGTYGPLGEATSGPAKV